MTSNVRLIYNPHKLIASITFSDQMSLQYAIQTTLAYHDIFGYPLTVEEIHRYLIKKSTSTSRVEDTLGHLLEKKLVGMVSKYYFLKGRSKIVSIRIKRKDYSKAKMRKAKLFGVLLKIIPSVKLAAISGALSMDNSRKNDDIDLVIITSKNLLWSTRFLANLFLLLFKRDPAGQKISDRACLNMFLDESALSISDRNIYTAHEICQMRVLWDREGTYRKFLRANSWIKDYLPNWQLEKITSSKSQVPSHKSFQFITNKFELITERVLRSFQLSYMKSKITTERISPTQLFFHPKDTQKQVLSEYQNRLNKLEI